MSDDRFERCATSAEAAADPTSDPDPRPAAHFAPTGSRADVAVLVVTYNSARHVDALLTTLADEATRLAVRVVVVDNSSTDDTLARLARWDRVVVVGSPNRGYAAGINVAMAHAGEADTLLVLNPDLTVEPGALAALLRRVRDDGAGVAVPLVRDTDGHVALSLRREPTVLRVWGDALVGARLAGRPGTTGETERDPGRYTAPHPVDWATGAALLVRTDVAAQVGAWDERYFMYSEETDYLRRVREAGHEVWFEPAAVVVHEAGGSGTSPALHALMEVNRVRYARQHGGAVRAQLVRAGALVGALLRSSDPGARLAVRRLLDGRAIAAPEPPPTPRSASTDPATTNTGSAAAGDRPFSASVVIPAHDEERGIARTLGPLAAHAAAGRLEVVVVCNGCTDRTADVARGFAGVRVIELTEPSKTRALRAGDDAATRFPRIYLDADVLPDVDAVPAVAAALDGSGPLAARPRTRDDLSGAGPAVRAFYRVRGRIPALHEHLWGAGCYAVDERGHARIATWPDVTADDLWVDQQFTADERTVVDEAVVTVRRPRTTPALLRVLRRTRRRDPGVAPTGTPVVGPRAVLRTVRGPRSFVDAAVYVLLTLAARIPTGRAARWERDETSRA